MNISTVNEIIASLESAGELSIKERKYLDLAKAYADKEAESVAQALTFEKCRELTNCPAGVDLQDWVKKLAAENLAMKQAIDQHRCGFVVCPSCSLEISSSTDDVCYVLDGTPATDRIYAGIKADAFEEAAVELETVDTIASTRVIAFKLREFAKQLREGTK